jgi:3'-phosphoadenosine 5'-phosphosulfate sulfotransferase (PAPS reductase)/FAD synthetase
MARHQHSLFNSGPPAIATTPEIDALIAAHAPVAIGVSGGKDSQAAGIATIEHLDRAGHTGRRILVHSDLGAVEWNESLPSCQRLAGHLGLDLVIVRRGAGDLMERWESRWASSVRRYANLETVTLVLPWSTPSMRFCTSELKTHLIAAELRRRFPGESVVSVNGVRREESAARARAPIADQAGPRLWIWRPIVEWRTEEVFAFIAASGVALHPAYRDYGISRVSCRFCIMAGMRDLTAAAAVPESHDLYRRMVGLEIDSTFAFQGSRWLGDVAPQLLSAAMQRDLAAAKQKAMARMRIESAVTKEMRYVKGWPTRMLSDDEARTLAQVRRSVAALMPIDAQYLDVAAIHGRYAELMTIRAQRDAQR